MVVLEAGNASAWDAARAANRLGSASLVLLIVVCVLGGAASLGNAGPLLLVAAGLVGLPHGAADHLVLRWAREGSDASAPVMAVAYAASAVAVAGIAIRYPVPAVVALLLLSVVHFADGEVAFDRLRGGEGRPVPALALSLCVVALPLLLHPELSRFAVSALDPRLPEVLTAARIPLLSVTALLVAVGLADAARSGERRVLAELAAVAALSVMTPSLLFFAVWFGGWHSPRHVLRLIAAEPVGALRQRARTFAVGAFGPTVVALVGLAGLAVVLGGLPNAVLIGLLALTVPHSAVVSRLSRLERHTTPPELPSSHSHRAPPRPAGRHVARSAAQ